VIAMEEEIKRRLDAIDNAIDQLFALHGLHSPRMRALQIGPGEDQCGVVNGLIMVRSKP
jgi:hypothetical protein